MLDTSHRISVRDHMVAQAANGLTFFDAMQAIGLGAFELQVDIDLTTPHVRQPDGSPYSLASEDGVVAFRSALISRHLRLSGILLMTDFSSDQPETQVAWAVRAAQLARELGASAVRVDPLTRKKELPQHTVRDNFIAGIRQVLGQTRETGVDLGIENHGPFGNDPVFLDAVFSAVGDERLGMTLDTGNFYWWGVSLEELYELLKRYAGRTKHTHIKNINYPPDLAAVRRAVGLDYAKYCCSLDEGNIDLGRVVKLLTDAGYTRDFCIENESLGKHPADVRLALLQRDASALRRALA